MSGELDSTGGGAEPHEAPRAPAAGPRGCYRITMEKRHYRRFRGEGLSTQVYSGARHESGDRVEDLSLNGAFIRTAHPMPVRSPVVLELTGPTARHPIHLTGRVVSTVSPEESAWRHHAPGMGVAFNPSPPQVEERLRELLEHLAELAPPAEGTPEEVVVSVVVEIDLPQRRPAEVPHIAPVAVPETAQLMGQVRELLVELSRWQQKVRALETEVSELKEELRSGQDHPPAGGLAPK